MLSFKSIVLAGFTVFTVIGAVPAHAEGGDYDCKCEPEEPEPKVKGNNGWGNGAEGINNGSSKGGTQGSKSDETWTDGDGPQPASGKFDTR